MEYSNAFVCLMGMGTVFVGLICIILLCTLMSKLLGRPTAIPAAPQPVTAAPSGAALSPEAVAAVSAVIAEETGADLSAIRILSIRKL